MRFKVNAELAYTAHEACTVILNIHALRGSQQIISESFYAGEHFRYTELASFPDENRLARILVETPGNLFISYNAEVDNAFSTIDFEGMASTPVSVLEPKVLTYLNPSRFCQSDRLLRLANHQFGKIANDFEKVLAITEWIHTNVEYLSGSTNSETSAFDTVTQQAGVCRDFAHLGIALCRALTIPARYCAVYAYQLIPQDFHACFEAYIFGRWIIFDATKLVPLNGLVKIAVGRDAADTAIANLFDNIEGNSLTVDVQLAEASFNPYYYASGLLQGLSYE